MRRLNEGNDNWAFILQPKFVGEKHQYEENQASSELRSSQQQLNYGVNGVSLLTFS